MNKHRGKDTPCCVNQGQSFGADDKQRYSTDPDYNISMSNSTYRQNRVQSERREESAWGNQKVAEEGLSMRQKI